MKYNRLSRACYRRCHTMRGARVIQSNRRKYLSSIHTKHISSESARARCEAVLAISVHCKDDIKFGFHTTCCTNQSGLRRLRKLRSQRHPSPRAASRPYQKSPMNLCQRWPWSVKCRDPSPQSCCFEFISGPSLFKDNHVEIGHACVA